MTVMDPKTQLEPIYLIDASVYVFRAWYGYSDTISDQEGHPVNAVHGFTRFLLDVFEQERPKYIAIAFDGALGMSFRHQLYALYKANREPAPDALRRQFSRCKALCQTLGLPVLAHPNFEADDLIGSALMACRAQSLRGVLVSADKDLSQLLGDQDQQWDFARQQRWGGKEVKARHGVHPDQMADFLALCGDAVDNIPGVRGIGRKTAIQLLE